MPFDGCGDFWNAAGKLRYGGFPFLMLRLTKLKKILEQIDEIIWVGNVLIQTLTDSHSEREWPVPGSER